MASIAEHMSNFAGHKGHTISGHMDGSEGKHEPEHEVDGVHDHLKALHEKMGGTHMHIHQHEGGYTTHHVKEDGKVHGPHDHHDLEELKDHQDHVFSEEEREPPEDRDGLM